MLTEDKVHTQQNSFLVSSGKKPFKQRVLVMRDRVLLFTSYGRWSNSSRTNQEATLKRQIRSKDKKFQIALSDKVRNNSFYVVDSLAMDSHRTKDVSYLN